jgi:hypothetical protein
MSDGSKYSNGWTPKPCMFAEQLRPLYDDETVKDAVDRLDHVLTHAGCFEGLDCINYDRCHRLAEVTIQALQLKQEKTPNE